MDSNFSRRRYPVISVRLKDIGKATRLIHFEHLDLAKALAANSRSQFGSQSKHPSFANHNAQNQEVPLQAKKSICFDSETTQDHQNCSLYCHNVVISTKTQIRQFSATVPRNQRRTGSGRTNKTISKLPLSTAWRLSLHCLPSFFAVGARFAPHTAVRQWCAPH